MTSLPDAAERTLPRGRSLPVPQRVVLFNVKYSPNLGDGLLSECLERELGRALPGCDVVSIDLAGRRHYPLVHGRARGAVLALLERCPASLRRLLAGAMLHLLLAFRLRAHYRRALRGAEAVVLGGGNLFTDAELNFPVKIWGALGEASRKSVPVAVFAVGVARTWSRPAARLFGGALGRTAIVAASVRDEKSRETWSSHFRGTTAPLPDVVVDPGVLASLHFPVALRRKGSRKIGLCVTDPLAVRYHSTRASAANLEAWYPAALQSLVAHGFEVALFTNGSPEDRGYLYRRFEEWIRRAKGPVTLSRSFDDPAALTTFVSGCDGIIGHRMHACIAAFSFGVPAVGLLWDPKLDSFFDMSGRSAHMLDPARVSGREAGERILAALADPFDPRPLIARAQAQVAGLAASLQTTLAERVLARR